MTKTYSLIFIFILSLLGTAFAMIGRPGGDRSCSGQYTIGSLRDVAICEFPPGNGNRKRAGGPMVKPGDKLAFNGTHFVGEDHQVSICHQRNGLPSITISVSPMAVNAHLAHGDSLGPCNGGGNGCPAECDDVCPSACGNTTGQQGPQGEQGV